eukprot:gnl/MRDRNA2_/MRDRNA2_95230_c0_seq1.p1 gnl/MRDRNA2_/MRDRNA2_95230_c0~~gnl/MRDRNA2_/MRDRNA2_95230_c0_seq1.p1  ORF type:complete len:470 (+),score=84.39 gnl/MRDRNA2_/MRDRNA2_95230_c0_seq1:80-1489(+)
MNAQERSLNSSDHATKRIPHYALKTVAHSAPEFANHEQDIIRQSFTTGNRTWMKESLPVELGPDAINLNRRQRMERNRLAEPIPQTWSKTSQLLGGGSFQEFEYLSDSYDRKHQQDVVDQKEHKEKMAKISKHGWRHASQEKKQKHEPMLLQKDAWKSRGVQETRETYPHLGGDKALEIPPASAAHCIPQWLDPKHSGRHWDHEKNMSPRMQSGGAFCAGRGTGLDDDSRMSRMKLPLMIKRLQKRLDEDWDDATVVVSATDQDLVQVAFYMGSVDSERGVLAYMHLLSKGVDLLGDLGLRKVSQLWGMKRDFTQELQMKRDHMDIQQDEAVFEGEENPENTWIFFLLAPKWVRMRPTDAYYTVHPRVRGSQFCMSTAGSSVLLSLGSSVFQPMESVARSLNETSKDNEDFAEGSKFCSQKNSTKLQGVTGPKPDLGLIEQALASMHSSMDHKRTQNLRQAEQKFLGEM